jgi:negative regulator of sigma E activity
MTLSIEDLRVDSYATQLSELELTELKGGATPAAILPYLAYVGVAAAVTAVGMVVTSVVNSNSVADNDHKECDYQTTTMVSYGPNGSTTTVSTVHHICNEKK